MKALFALAIALALGTLGAGCQENWQSFYIQEVKALNDPPECIAPAVESAPYMSSGTLDVSLRNTYQAFLFVNNGLISREDPTLPVAESNGIFVQAAVVNIEPDPQCGGAVAATEFEWTEAAFIEPSSVITLGVTLIPPAVGAGAAGAVAGCPDGKAHVTAVVQLFGITQGGIDVATQQFSFPITICSGCLLYYPPPLSPSNVADCESTSPSITESPCLIGQDRAVDFRLVEPCLSIRGGP
jgi:hypothetical protein